ncbi:MAG: STAS domain-containing protein [Clostridia bacterium]|nr:STAS domain-containing protein [Clostridia bacterium]
MNIGRERNGNELTLTVEGRLDTNTAPQLQAELEKEYNSTEKLILDFKDLAYISSAGLRVLLLAHKTMSQKGGLKVRNVGDIVGEVFSVTGFADVLDIQ